MMTPIRPARPVLIALLALGLVPGEAAARAPKDMLPELRAPTRNESGFHYLLFRLREREGQR